jgi:hypothetical protein
VTRHPGLLRALALRGEHESRGESIGRLYLPRLLRPVPLPLVPDAEDREASRPPTCISQFDAIEQIWRCRERMKGSRRVGAETNGFSGAVRCQTKLLTATRGLAVAISGAHVVFLRGEGLTAQHGRASSPLRS